MQPETLFAVAQVAIGLGGFAGLYEVIKRRLGDKDTITSSSSDNDADNRTPQSAASLGLRDSSSDNPDSMNLKVVLVTSILVSIMTILPAPLANLENEVQPLVWAVFSGIAAVLTLVAMFYTLVRVNIFPIHFVTRLIYPTMPRVTARNAPLGLLSTTMVLSSFILLCLNIGYWRSGDIYLFSLTIDLGIALIVFFIAMFSANVPIKQNAKTHALDKTEKPTISNRTNSLRKKRVGSETDMLAKDGNAPNPRRETDKQKGRS